MHGRLVSVCFGCSYGASVQPVLYTLGCEMLRRLVRLSIICIYIKLYQAMRVQTSHRQWDQLYAREHCEVTGKPVRLLTDIQSYLHVKNRRSCSSTRSTRTDLELMQIHVALSCNVTCAWWVWLNLSRPIIWINMHQYASICYVRPNWRAQCCWMLLVYVRVGTSNQLQTYPANRF